MLPTLAIIRCVYRASVASSVRTTSSNWLQSRRPLGGAVHGISAGESADEAPDLAAHRQADVVVDHVVDTGPPPGGGRFPGAVGHVVGRLREVVPDDGRPGAHDGRIARGIGRVG